MPAHSTHLPLKVPDFAVPAGTGREQDVRGCGYERCPRFRIDGGTAGSSSQVYDLQHHLGGMAQGMDQGLENSDTSSLSLEGPSSETGATAHRHASCRHCIGGQHHGSTWFVAGASNAGGPVLGDDTYVHRHHKTADVMTRSAAKRDATAQVHHRTPVQPRIRRQLGSQSINRQERLRTAGAELAGPAPQCRLELALPVAGLAQLVAGVGLCGSCAPAGHRRHSAPRTRTRCYALSHIAVQLNA